MAGHIALDCLSKILSYPQDDLLPTVEALLIHMQSHQCSTEAGFTPFATWSRETTLAQQEEEYIRVFDFDPATSLELGWHLYGENYERGAFLVKMRDALAEAGISESSELPDHLTSILQLLAIYPKDQAQKLAQEIVRPALDKLMPAIVKKETPYLAVLLTLQGVMAKKWGIISEGVPC